MGRTVAELEATLSTEELCEWEAFYTVEPFGSPADDNRWRLHYSLFYQVNSEKGATEPDWLDYTPEETARAARIAQAHVTLDDKLEAFFSAIAIEADEVVLDAVTIEADARVPELLPPPK